MYDYPIKAPTWADGLKRVFSGEELNAYISAFYLV